MSRLPDRELMRYTLRDLFRLPKLQELTDNLYDATGIPCTIVDRDGAVLTASGWQRVCMEFHRKHPELAKGCRESDRTVGSSFGPGTGFVVYECPRRLTDASAPITIGGERVGTVFVGQVFLAPLTPGKEALYRADARALGLEEEEYIEALREVPVFTPEGFHKALGFLARLTTLIADLGMARHREREAAAQARALAARYRTLFEESAEGVLLSDGESGEVLEANRAFLALTGYRREELTGRSRGALAPPDGGGRRPGPGFPRGLRAGGESIREIMTRDGSRRQVEVRAGSPISIDGRKVEMELFRDVTEEMAFRRERESTLGLLEILTLQGTTNELVRGVARYLQEWTGCEAVGVRLERNGDFPYFATRGFPAEFVQAESSLCAPDTDGAGAGSRGRPVLECMCGNVIRGRFDPALPFFTPKGSFWSNGTTALLADTTEAERQSRTRNRCNGEGYESVALIPLRAGGRTLGLLQVNDHAEGRFTPELLAFLEKTADQVAIALAERQAQGLLAESEQRFRTLVENAADSLFVHDRNGRFVDANRRACESHGYSREELLAMSVDDITAGSVPAEARSAWARITPGEDSIIRGQSRRKDGSVFPVEAHLCGIELHGTQYILGLVRDLTERTRAEREAARHQAELTAIYENAPVMMCLVGEDRRVERSNRAMAAAAERAGSGALPLLGSLLGCRHASDNPDGCGSGPRCGACRLRLAVEETFATGVPRRQVEHAVPGAAGQELCLSVSTGLLAVEGSPKVLVCMEDITGLRQLEAQLIQAQKMDAVGQLAGGVAHDFNNILTATMMNIELLEDNPRLDPATADGLREIRRESARAANLTRQLLLFSRRQAMESRRLEMGELTSGLASMLGRLLGEHIEVVLQAGPDPLWVEADGGMLEQVIVNLCVNARDAMPRGGRLTLGLSPVELSPSDVDGRADARPGRYALLVVEDSGCGMTPETLGRIFEPFFTTKEAGKGTGLGLSTVYGIVRQHSGWTEVESTLGAGSVFRVYIPLAGPAADAPASVEVPVPRGQGTILVVEDQPEVRELLVHSLGYLGYEVLSAATGEEAVGVWERQGERIRLVLTDMVMPGGMTGLELITRLRGDRPDLRVILSSGYSADLLKEGTRERAGVQFLAKPYGTAALAEAVRSCLAGS
jgi:PAS domain S-box-containing protein